MPCVRTVDARSGDGPRHLRSKWLVLLALFVAALLIGFMQNGGPSVDEGTQESTGNTIAEADLPAEAQETLALIDDGGPYPYRQDDGVFGNRERLLPDQPSGHYREYTVETPGEDDRGARRLIMGRDGEVYYTSDHYASFKQVERSRR